MSIIDKIREPFARIADFLETEKEIIKLKMVRAIGHLSGNFLAAIFMIVFFNVVLSILSIWLGIWLGSVFDNYVMGFGISVALFFLVFIILVVFRKQLLVKPFENIVIQTTVDLDKIVDEAKKDKEQSSAQ